MNRRTLALALAGSIVVVAVAILALRKDAPEVRDDGGASRSDVAADAGRGAAGARSETHGSTSSASAADAALVGRVTLGGEGAAGATVLVHPRTAPDSWPGGRSRWLGIDVYAGAVANPPAARVRTTADGSFRVGRLPDDEYLVVGRDRDGRVGTASTIVRDGIGRPRPLEVELGDGSLTLSLRVLDGGAPARGVVIARSTLVALDAEGRAEIAGLEPGRTRVLYIDDARSRVVGRRFRAPREGERVWELRDGARAVVGGRVVDASTDEPVPGATVLVRGGGAFTAADAPFEVRELAANAEGRFATKVLEPVGPIRGRADGYAPGAAAVFDDPADVVVPLTPYAGVRGRVVDAEGAPIGGALVAANRRSTFGGHRSSRTTAAADGSFVLPEVPPGLWTVAVVGQGGLSPGLFTGDATLEVDVPPDGLEGLTLVARRAAIVRGTVLDADGAPAAGVPVSARSDHRLPTWVWQAVRNHTTDARGAFRLASVLPDHAYTVRAGGAQVEAIFRAGENPPLELRLDRPTVLDVAVVDAASGAPIEGASFLIRQDRSGSRPWRNVRTDADGRATLTVDGSEVRSIEVSADGYVTSDPLRPPDGDEPMRIELRPGAVVEGRIVGADGEPVGRRSFWVGSTGVMTDEDGVFRATVSGPGTHVLRLHGIDPMDVEAPSSGVEVRLPAPVVIHVVDAEGRTVRSGQYMLWTRGGGSGGPIPATGRIEEEPRESNPAEQYLTLSDLPSLAGGRVLGGGVYGPLGPPDATGEYVVRVGEAAPIRGRVVGPDGAPVANAEVIVAAWPAEAGRSPTWRPVFTAARARSGADGRFEILAFRAGDYPARAEPTGDYLPAEATVTAGGPETTFRVARSVTGTIRVLGPTSAPIAGAAVRVRAEGFRSSGVTDRDGTFVLRQLDATVKYHVHVDPGRDADVLAQGIGDWSPSKPLEIELRAAREIGGVVVDRAGEPVTTARVSIRFESGRGKSFRTDERGRFRGRIAAAPFRVRASDADLRAPAGPDDRLVGRAEDATDLRLVIERQVPISITYPAEARGERVRIFSEGPNGGGDFRRSLPRGEPMVLRGWLERDHSYTIWVPMPDDDHYALKTGVRLDDGRVDLELTRGATLSGTIRDGDRPVRANLIVSRGALEVQKGSDEDGRFRFRGLPPGEWTIRVFVAGDQRMRDRGTFTAATGAPVEIEIPE